MVKSFISEVAGLIKVSLDSTNEEFSKYSRIYLTGGGLLYMRGAREYLSKELEMSCVQAVPTIPEYGEPRKTSTYALLEMALKHSGKKTAIWQKWFN